MSYEQNSTTNSTLTLKVERVEDPASSRVQPEDLGIRNLRHGHFIFSVLRGSLQDTTIYNLDYARDPGDSMVDIYTTGATPHPIQPLSSAATCVLLACSSVRGFLLVRKGYVLCGVEIWS
ncbi:hypothetical protein CBS147343_1531 [Aspergillus niger]|nr:hypothetical protein CBS147371_2562 [Aspergillus niger]KAI2982351.1 hypothetical protein CBS147344_8785 [Aspergillus niger]KAI2985563.1 hypothetical protein CBS147345_11027 [Aspergillus niger]KAI3089354.1 hypothetical protein CBS147343_1531 [Aspergillus niger]